MTFHGGEDMPGEMSDIQQVWDRQSVWSQGADRLNRLIGRTRLASLLLGAASAVMGAAAAQTMQLGLLGKL